MRTRRKRLIDVEPNYTTQGIFNYLNNVAGIPWSTPANVLNAVYYGNHSGQKSASPMVRMMAKLNANGILSISDEQYLSGICAGMYLENWKKQFATLSAQYDPIENYNMTEEEYPAETTRTITPAETTETRTPAETTTTITPAETTVTETPAETTETTTPAETTVTETPAETTETTTPAETTVTETPAETTETTTPAETTATGSNESGIFGFDSSDAVGSDTLSAETKYTTDAAGTIKRETDTAGTVKTETDTAGTVKKETDTAGTVKTEIDTAGTVKTETDTAGTVKTEIDAAGTEKFEVDENEVIKHETDSAGTEKFEVDTARSLERHGNIGVTTSQQMLQSEHELWLWNFFFDVVFPDLDKILCLYVYNNANLCL